MTMNDWLNRPVLKGLGLTCEQALYLLIVVLCLVSRLAMLGYRVQSHDESLHCKFSWDLYTGIGFQHNPMMHGPVHFHIAALSFFLFGDSDFTVRLPVAILGTVLVATPYLFRRYLGRTGALVASFLLLISPSISYYSRYIREDIPTVLWAVLFFWAILRYMDEGRERHLYIMAAAFSLMYATKEVSFIYTAIFGLFLLGLLVVRALETRWENYTAETVLFAALIGLVVGLLVLALGLAFARGEEVASVLKWLQRLGGAVALLSLIAGAVALLWNFWGRRSSDSPPVRLLDLIIFIGTFTLPFASPLPMLGAAWLARQIVARYPAPEYAPPFWTNLSRLRPIDYNPPSIYYSGFILGLMVLLAVVIGLLWDRRRWPVAAAVYFGIFVTLFTTIFTNGAGIASGWVGSLGYWLEQQEVQRGGQPWFYYLVIIPLYDFLPLLGTIAAFIALPIAAIIRAVRRTEAAAEGSTVPFIPFVVFWILLSWFGYSYAGEKMPWLSVHIVLPMILLTAYLVGRLLEAVDWRAVGERYGWFLLLLFPLLGAALGAVVSAWGQGPFAGETLDQLLVTGTFLGGLIGVGFVGYLVLVFWQRVGGRNGLLLLAVTAFLLLSLLTARIAYRLNFINFDRPAEFLVYAHEGPDVRTTMEILEKLSLRVAGGPRLIDVTYGPDGSWPFIWYLRNYPNARYYPDRPSREQVLATAVIAGREQWAVVEPYLGDDYYQFDFFFLWWPMEDYRRLTLPKLWEWLKDGQKRAALWRIFFYMDYSLYDQITGTKHTPNDWPLRGDFRLYIRKDVADRLWDFQVGPRPPEETTAAPPDPYGGGWRALAPVRTWGTEGAGMGQFSAPRGIAVSADGFVYVADSRNHRIQKFTADGLWVASWGTFGGCPERTPLPGEFCEPWGVAVGPDGSVYVADTWAHRVQKFSPDGQFLAQWGFSSQYGADQRPGAFYGPRGITVAPDGTVYVADTGNKRVQVFRADGVFLRQLGGGGSEPGRLNEPVGLAVGPDGNLYVADTWNYRVQALTPTGQMVRQWPIVGWNNPLAEEKPYLAVDGQGRVYVTDPGHYRVLVFDAQGNYLYSFGQFGFDAASFALPMGIAVGPDGALYITDAVNHRVAVYRP